MGFERISIGHHRISLAAGSDKASPIATRRHLATRQIERLAFAASLGEVEILAVARDLATILEVVLIGNLLLVAFIIDVPHVKEHVLSVWILGDAEQGVWRFALILPAESSSDGHHSTGMRLVAIECPSGDVELMGSLIVQVAIPRLPKPMPVCSERNWDGIDRSQPARAKDSNPNSMAAS